MVRREICDQMPGAVTGPERQGPVVLLIEPRVPNGRHQPRPQGDGWMPWLADAHFNEFALGAGFGYGLPVLRERADAAEDT